MATIVIEAQYECPFCSMEAAVNVSAKIDDMTRKTVACNCGGHFDVVVNLEVDVWAEIPPVIHTTTIDYDDVNRSNALR